MILLTIAVAKKIIGLIPLWQFLAFALVVREIVNDYFQRTDRLAPDRTNPAQKPVNEIPITEQKVGVE